MERPRSVVDAERLGLLAVALFAAGGTLSDNGGLGAGALAVIVGLQLLPAILIPVAARWRSDVALGVLVVFAAAAWLFGWEALTAARGVFDAPQPVSAAIVRRARVADALRCGAAVLGPTALLLMWTRSARAWRRGVRLTVPTLRP